MMTMNPTKTSLEATPGSYLIEHLLNICS